MWIHWDNGNIKTATAYYENGAIKAQTNYDREGNVIASALSDGSVWNGFPEELQELVKEFGHPNTAVIYWESGMKKFQYSATDGFVTEWNKDGSIKNSTYADVQGTLVSCFN